jgi:RHS repeat-associated protein
MSKHQIIAHGAYSVADRLSHSASSHGLGCRSRYVYDGWRVIQERDTANTPTVSYTRGVDLSGTLEGAGGIGGLLDRTDHSALNPQLSTAFYHADALGNVTCLLDASQGPVARYRYDPFGVITAQSGFLADMNVYRFSSKEWHPYSGMYYYGYRFYDPSLQRWVNRDPIQEWGGANLYCFLENQPTAFVDLLGLAGKLCTGKTCDRKKCPAKNLPEEGWEDKVRKGENPWEDIPAPGKCADSDGIATPKGELKIPNNCTCTIVCNDDGTPKHLSCVCIPRWPWPRKPNPKDHFPPNPFPPALYGL